MPSFQTRADNKANNLILALTIPRLAKMLMPRQIIETRQNLRDLIAEVSPELKKKIKTVLNEV